MGYYLKTNYVLIDYENVQVRSLSLLKDECFYVRVFLGPKNPKLPVELVVAMQKLGDRADYIVLETSGSNALDFHIAYYLGIFSEKDPLGFFHIISKDTGFDPLIQHLKARKILSSRSASIEEMPCFNQVTTNTSIVGSTNEILNDNKPIISAEKNINSVDDMVKVAITDLIKRKSARPRTPKTLQNTIRATCGKDLPVSSISAVYESLIKNGYIKVNGEKVTYALPIA
jgi:hypothetical protein